MVLRTPRDLGALIRDRRRRLDLDQRTLAERVGVSRQWIVGIEQGKPRAELGLVLKTLRALGLTLTIGDAPVPAAGRSARRSAPDIDAIVARARKPSP